MAFATTMRSPISWVTSLRYGVSPQPAQAPENSNSGWSSCEPLTVSARTSDRSTSGSSVKYSYQGRSTSRCSIAGSRSIALCSGFALSRTGQTATQMPQPVQSSGATWTVSWVPEGISCPL